MNLSEPQTDLLFSVLALQNKFVSRTQLITALNLWAIDKNRSLAEIVCQQAAIETEDQNLLKRLVLRQLDVHGDVEASLCENSATTDLADHCSQIADSDLREQIQSIVDRAATSQLTTVRPSPQSLQSRHSAADSITQPPASAEEMTSAHYSSNSNRSNPSSDVDLDATADSSPLAGPSNRSGSAQSTSGRFSELGPGIGGSRFSILSSYAKGGLGEVFLAKDTELDREVALKEIQHKFSSNEEARLRFEFEACITGGLEHPGVVPVYAYGKYPDGRPFYAMRFIRGRSMKDEIADYHQKLTDGVSADQARLALRGLLNRFIDTCQAMAYAHSRGVVHRDLKPANVMLGKYGETLVVDWGLAKSIGRDEYHADPDEVTLTPSSSISGSSGSGTIQGSTLGTPGYMSPEQAKGRLHELGPASDIFSLGATLYCILVGKAPFEGNKPRDIVEKASQNLFTEPIQLLSSVPKPLNAIVMKAMSTKPQQRYHTALELAQDVEAFLADDIVSAYRENVLEQIQRWIRRHRTLATAGFVLLSTLGIAALTAAVLINAEKNKTKLALQQVSTEQRKTADALAALTIEQEKTQQALAAETRARRQTREMLETISDDLVGEMMGQQVQLTESNERFFDRVLHQFEQFTETADSIEATTEAKNLRSDGFFRVANLQRRLNRLDQADKAYRQAIDSWQKLSDEFPTAPSYRYDLAKAQANLGLVFAEQANFTGALSQYQLAADLFNDLLAMIESSQSETDRAIDPDAETQTNTEDSEEMVMVSTDMNFWDQTGQDQVRLELARLQGNLANTYLRLNRLNEAEQHYQQALQYFADLNLSSTEVSVQIDRAKILGNYVTLIAKDPSRLKEARNLMREAIDVLSGGANRDPSTLPRLVRYERTIYLKNLGRILVGTGDRESAIETTQAAVQELQALSDEYPAITDHRRELASNQVALANLLRQTNPSEANEVFESAINSYQKILDQHPQEIRTQLELAASLDNWGQRLIEDDVEQALASLNQARQVRLQLHQLLPKNPVLRNEWVIGENNFANLQRQRKDYHSAIPIYRHLLDFLKLMEGEEIENDPQYPIKLWAARFGLADSLSRSDQYGLALPVWEELLTDRNDPRRKRYELQRAICLIRIGRVDEGLEVAMAVVEQPDPEGVLLFDVGCCYAIAHEMKQAEIAVAEQDESNEGDRQNFDLDAASQQLESYANQAMKYLQLAADAGFFDTKEMRLHAAGDNDLRSLADRQDFQQFSKKYFRGDEDY